MYKRITKLATVLALLVLPTALAACGTSEASEMPEVRNAIDAKNAGALVVFGQKTPAELVKFVDASFAEDATMFPPNEDMIQGKQAIGEYLNILYQAGLNHMEMTVMEIGGSGDTAYETGRYTIRLQPPGLDVMTDSGKYVMVWKRQADGAWKIQEDIWNSSAPAAGP